MVLNKIASRHVVRAPNGQVVLCFELNRQHVVVEDSFQRALAKWPLIFLAQRGIGRCRTTHSPARRQRGAPPSPSAHSILERATRKFTTPWPSKILAGQPHMPQRQLEFVTCVQTLGLLHWTQDPSGSAHSRSLMSRRIRNRHFSSLVVKVVHHLSLFPNRWLQTQSSRC